MSETIREFWALIVAGIAGLVWLVRLEARGVSNAAEVQRLWSQRKEDMATAKESRDRVDHKLDEMATDIKALLREARK